MYVYFVVLLPAGEEILSAEKGLLFVGVMCCYNLGGPKTSSYVTVSSSSTVAQQRGSMTFTAEAAADVQVVVCRSGSNSSSSSSKCHR